jgi:hypothetical protein
MFLLDVQHLGFLVAAFHSLTKTGCIILQYPQRPHVIPVNTPFVNVTRPYHEKLLARAYLVITDT